MTPDLVADYARADVMEALRRLGVREGHVVLTHSSVGMLGLPAEGGSKEAIAELFLSAFLEVLGPSGIWVLPAYTYSLTRGETFDPDQTAPQNMGLLAEMLWRHPQAIRSADPIFSVIAFGFGAADFVSDLPHVCFGAGSVYARLLEADGAVCNVGIGSHSALIHHVEQKLGVPYRIPKTFGGKLRKGDDEREETWVYHVRDLDQPRHEPYFRRLDADGRAAGAVTAVPLGRGEMNLIRATELERLVRLGLAHDPEYLVLGDLAGLPVG